jgi:hypothetical protein
MKRCKVNSNIVNAVRGGPQKCEFCSNRCSCEGMRGTRSIEGVASYDNPAEEGPTICVEVSSKVHTPCTFAQHYALFCFSIDLDGL